MPTNHPNNPAYWEGVLAPLLEELANFTGLAPFEVRQQLMDFIHATGPRPGRWFRVVDKFGLQVVVVPDEAHIRSLPIRSTDRIQRQYWHQRGIEWRDEPTTPG